MIPSFRSAFFFVSAGCCGRCVVAFSPSVADALPSILREGIDLRLAPQVNLSPLLSYTYIYSTECVFFIAPFS